MKLITIFQSLLYLIFYLKVKKFRNKTSHCSTFSHSGISPYRLFLHCSYVNNHNTSVEDLMKLIEDEEAMLDVLENPNTPVDVLVKFSENEDNDNN